MAGARKSEVQLNLFPFLSVLCATMGVLMLFMVVIMSTRALAALVAPPPPPPPPAKTGKGPEQSGPVIDKAVYEARQRELEQLARQLAQRQVEYQQLHRKHAELRSQIESKEDELDRLQQQSGERVYVGRPLGQKDPVRVVPDRSAVKTTKKPVVVEVKAEGFVVHPEKRQHAVAELDQPNSPLGQFLSEIDRACEEKYLLLLIHPNGADSFDKLTKYLPEHHGKSGIAPGGKESRIDLGWEPFSVNWLYWQEQQKADQAR